MTDLSRIYKNNEKKTYSVFSAKVVHTDVNDALAHEIFKLPPNCLIVDATCVVEVAGQASLTVDLGFDGGNELGNDLDIDAISVVSVPLTVSGTGTIGTKSPRLATGTGKTVTVDFSANPTAGVFHFIVEVVEYTKGNGQLSDYVQSP